MAGLSAGPGLGADRVGRVRVCRAFWAKKYSEIKLANPTLPILIRESEGTPAKLMATYGRTLQSAPRRPL